jgi:HRD ubiquitin ligase complex, ER membrane component
MIRHYGVPFDVTYGLIVVAVGVQSLAFINLPEYITSKAKMEFLNVLKKLSILVLVLILTASVSLASVNAQGTATVTVQTTTEGTTDVTGTTNYPDGSQVTITAAANAGFAFQNFVVSPSDGSGDMLLYDNPVTFTVTGGVTYTVVPVFVTPLPIPGQSPATDLSKAAIIIIFPSAGGNTIPAPGTYALADASAFNLTAMASAGWQFSHWTICGTNASHGAAPVNWTPTDNPYNVNHGYGDTYRYQAVFTPTSSSTNPSPSVPELSAIVLVALLLALVTVVVVARRHRR